MSTAINMGGTFSFGGVDYTTCYIHANGYITFWTPLTPTTYTPISTLGNTSGAISAFGVNGAGSSATGAMPEISYTRGQLTKSKKNRVKDKIY